MALAKNVRNDIGSWMKSGQDVASQGYSGTGAQMAAQTGRAGGVWNQNQDWGLGQLHDIYDQIGEGGGGGIPGYQGQFDASKNWWQQVADTGWRTPEQKDAGWGWGNFKDFAQTGGWTPEQMADFRARSLSGQAETYGGLRNEVMRGKTVQGGYGPGYSESLSKIARDRARSIGEAALGAETNLATSIRQGKQWGSEQGAGAAKSELANMEQGQQQVDSIAQRIADMNRAAAASRLSSSQANLAMKLGIIDKVTGLARQTGGDIDYANAANQSYAGLTAADNAFAQTYAAANQKKDIWDKLGSIGSLVGAGAGAAAGLGYKPFASTPG